MGGAGGGCGAEGGRQVPFVRRDSGVETEQMAGTWWRENVGLWLWKVQPWLRYPCSLFRKRALTQASSACIVLSVFDIFTACGMRAIALVLRPRNVCAGFGAFHVVNGASHVDIRWTKQRKMHDVWRVACDVCRSKPDSRQAPVFTLSSAFIEDISSSMKRSGGGALQRVQ